jgi:hypothetical protein
MRAKSLILCVVAGAAAVLLLAHAGRTSPAESVSVHGIGAKLFDRTLTGDSTTIDTGPGGVAAGYSVLTIYIVARTDDRTGGDGTDGRTLIPIYVTLNGDTGANYDFTYVVRGGFGTFGHGVLRGQRAWEMTAHGSGGVGNYAAVDRITIPDYTAAFGKVGEATTASPDGMADDDSETVVKSLGWRSDAAIDRLTVSTRGANKLVAGSRLLIYGS